ncbi:LytR/AlgR family response regulator transcription factor [Tenacibaculum amylolyticum]|uniref:LytR/AlgR family response regulator transcription factor n=1 Tax=Tenacibaculum amylolyticum TaxID=104269 RepID=UPI0038956C50
MKTYNVIIVDDEHMASTTLQNYINEFCPNLKVIAIANGGEDGYKKITELTPDLVFLDIQMPRVNGFEMLKMFTEITFDIIFCTAYNEFAINAFKFSAFDYLLKPIGISELKETVNRYTHQKNKTNLSLTNNIKSLLQNIDISKKQITIPEIGSHTILHTSNIICLKSDCGYTNIHCCDGSKITSSKTLKHFHSILTNNPNFYEIGKSSIINLNYISKYFNEGVIVLKNNIKITVPRRVRKEFLENLP